MLYSTLGPQLNLLLGSTEAKSSVIMFLLFSHRACVEHNFMLRSYVHCSLFSCIVIFLPQER